MRDVLLGLIWTSIMGGLLYVSVSPAGAIWRGDADRVPQLGQISVNARSYLAFLLWSVPFFGGGTTVGLVFVIGTLTGSRDVLLLTAAKAAFALILVSVPLIGLHWFVNAFGRPEFLIPPPYRGQRGRFAEARERRRRQRGGLPPTDHLVEIHDVRPLPTAAEPFSPYLVASCTEPGCDWMELSDTETT
ncbi:MAG TPA: hypothetical protein VF163_03855, partial [Micromonosporaceae bacterium]